ncbi:tricorn protease [Herbihabitans rhizosphaerae]|uniref:Tricorn protease homolog n=1 Tax=Herbihabitans rhizosphaerae TaxID=1872711 RepID=A0A4Q7KWW8_9PSEU|nr:S41 family peptidase [Herbihabitans rhizosphaerae]RZS40780.1 tricorn protease [Herbihabitans rhizosphaerae]
MTPAAIPAYLRFPHPHGDLVTFVAEDDVWLAPLDGGRAWRVSADQVPVTNPRFSPDGTLIAWTSTRDVDPEVHVAPVDGGASRRLTYWGDPKTTVLGWTPDGEVIASTSTGQPSTRRTWAHTVPADGGTPTRLPYGPVGGVAHGPGGALLLVSANSSEPAHWKRYRGGTAGKLWHKPGDSTEFTRVLSEVDGNVSSPMFVGERIAFLSDHEGVAALYSANQDGSDLRRHGGLGEFYARNATTDGTRVVYHAGGRLYIVDSLDGEPRELEIRLGGPRVNRQPYPVSAREELTEFTPDHAARASVVEVRGTVHWLTHRDGPARALSAAPGVRARMPRVLGDTGRAAWITDADGEDALEIASVDGGSGRRIGGGTLGRVLELEAAPDGRRLALITHDGRVLLVDTDDDTDTDEITEVARGGSADPSDLAFSPDSAWLAWSHPGPNPLRHIRILEIATLSTVDVTPLRFADYAPAFTADGKHLVFLSARSFDPVYDAHVFDMSFLNGSRPFLVPLAATTPSPFAPTPAGRPVGDPDGDHKGEDGAAPHTEVDPDGIADRVVPFPVPAARYSALLPAKGGVLWMRHPTAGVLGTDLSDVDDDEPRPVLERYDLAKRKVVELADGVDDVAVSGDGARIVIRDGRTLRVLPSDHKADSDDDDNDNVEVDLSRVRVWVRPPEEWAQEYAETGRLMRDHFWRADLGGVDWSGVLDRYRPLLDTIGCYDEFVDLLWEVQGELGTSHAYVWEADGYRDARVRLGLLGADLERDGDGRWRVAAVLPGESSDPEARSPLRAPGVAVREGDAILAVDGHDVDPDAGPAPLLVGTADKPVELTVAPAAGGEPRRVVVVPLHDEMASRYQAWVAGRRDHVHQATGGRVGYLHVPDMVASGWAQLHRDLRLEMARDAVIVDVRENRGGHLSQLVVEKLGRRIVGWSTGRDGYHASTYPADAPRGPVVAVADEFSGSDGDIVNAAIKALGIGPVVGTRTWGGVIGIDMRYHLVDGTLVTQPRYATWMQGPGWGVENRGVEPDVEVVMTPADHAEGRDPQLDTAIALALDALAERPAATLPEIPPLA